MIQHRVGDEVLVRHDRLDTVGAAHDDVARRDLRDDA
jgi:hypothetical protein